AAGRRPRRRLRRRGAYVRRAGRGARSQGAVAAAGAPRGSDGMSTVTETGSGVGQSVRRPDGIPKVKGEFAYASDAWADRMLWGSTLRSPHPRAKIRSIE